MYDARTRDRFRVAVAGATGLVAVASATAVGALAGLAARDTVPQAAPAPDPSDAVSATATPQRRPVRWRQRPQRTVVTTTVVRRQSNGSSLGGGTVTAAAPPAAPPAAIVGN